MSRFKNIFMMVLLMMATNEASSDNMPKIPTCEEKQEILDSHNNYRRAEGASNMNKIIWDDTLAMIASNYSLHCVWQHGDLVRPDLPYLLGQNLFASSRKTLNFSRAITAWFNEKPDFSFDANECAPGKVCGHYTQVVWANTAYIGCGYTQCSELKVPKKESHMNYLFVVCTYGPTGNFANSSLYDKGRPCSNCPEGFETCENKLCSSGKGYGDLDLKSSICKPVSSSSPPATPFSFILSSIYSIYSIFRG